MVSPKVVVFGDIMLDRYYQATTKKSPEHDGLCIVNPIFDHSSPGGAGNVAMCLARMGIPTIIIGMTGTNILDDSGAHAPLKKYLIDGTTLGWIDLDCKKDRYMCGDETITRIDLDPHFNAFRKYDKHVLEMIEDIPDSCEVLITSDYAKGSITESILQTLKGRFRTWIADPKKEFFDAYKTDEIIIKPNSAEALALTSTDNTLDAITKLADWTPGQVVVTNGKEPIHYDDKKHPFGLVFPGQRKPKTVVGAGDVMTAVLAVGALEGWDLRTGLEAAVKGCERMMSLPAGNTLDIESWNHIVTEVAED
jgi:D-beta-D-heptose 7-phosphate kinase/D-beta-D-heptose 1-phosphate adenosyltransferase